MTCVAEFRIGNDLAQIGGIRDGLDQLGQELGVPARPLMQLQVALDEVVSNVVRHAWVDGGHHELLVRITVLLGRVDVEVVDDGREFDPRSVPAPDPASASRRPPPGGLGLHLARKMVDEFTYRRIGGRNHTTLSKSCEVGVAVKRSER